MNSFSVFLDQLYLNYSYYYLALHYSGIKPKIYCEEYLDGLAETQYDYDIYCFHGEPRYIWRINGSHRIGCTAAFYDMDWKKQEFSYGYPMDHNTVDKPAEMDKILEFSKLLSQSFIHARVDWYIMPGGKIYFSEITFCTWGGLRRFCPDKYDEVFGKLILKG